MAGVVQMPARRAVCCAKGFSLARVRRGFHRTAVEGAGCTAGSEKSVCPPWLVPMQYKIIIVLFCTHRSQAPAIPEPGG